MISKMFLLLLLCMSQPAAATKSVEGQVTAQLSDSLWVLQYENKRYACKTTHLCKDFRVDMRFIPLFKFTREKELLDYVTVEHRWHDCVVNSCQVY